MNKLFGIIAVVTALFALAIPESAQAQVDTRPDLDSALSNANARVTTSATTNWTNGRPIPVRKGQGASITVLAGTTNGVSYTPTGIGHGFAVTPDGTNWTSAPHFWFVTPGPNTGGVLVITTTNIPPSVLDNWYQFKLIQTTNGNTNSAWFTNIIVGRKK